MGRLRDRRRGGGPSRTIGGLTRTGTASKVVGNKGGVQFPIVGETDAGEVFQIAHTTGSSPTVAELPKKRVTGIFLMSASRYADNEQIPESGANAGEHMWRWIEGSNKVAVWSNGGDYYFKFWVF